MGFYILTMKKIFKNQTNLLVYVKQILYNLSCLNINSSLFQIHVHNYSSRSKIILRNISHLTDFVALVLTMQD